MSSTDEPYVDPITPSEASSDPNGQVSPSVEPVKFSEKPTPPSPSVDVERKGIDRDSVNEG